MRIYVGANAARSAQHTVKQFNFAPLFNTKIPAAKNTHKTETAIWAFLKQNCVSTKLRLSSNMVSNFFYFVLCFIKQRTSISMLQELVYPLFLLYLFRPPFF